MNLIGPEEFDLEFTKCKFEKLVPRAKEGMSARARARRPKLYVVTDGQVPVYVGITRQPIVARLRYGWYADGRTGYYGYAWRRCLKTASLWLWFHPRRGKSAVRELETIEAEVVYEIRRKGQWPEHQTQIHFHPSSPEHRDAALAVLGSFDSGVAARRALLANNASHPEA
ncbi:MAG: hypothetical protein AAB074_17970 [Planctomycetota bacterium]|mgnify:CR=1 FL=1